MANNELLENINKSLSQIIELLKNLTLPSSSPQVVETPCKYTLFEWLDEWFNTYKVSTLRDKGYDMNNNIKKHIKQNIEDAPLNKILSLDITKALNKVQSERMRQLTRNIYNQAFNKAFELELIPKNPMLTVNAVKHTYENGRTLSEDEQKEFLYKSKTDTLRPLFMFYLLTGCRPSEPLTIKWDYIKNGHIRINGTKTIKSDRFLPMYSQLEKLLKTIPKISEYIFPYSYDLVRKHFDKIKEKLTFKNITLKDLRHTFGTRCIESGVTMKTLQKWLGHSNFDTTADIYSHITTEFEETEIVKFSSKVIGLKSDKFK